MTSRSGTVLLVAFGLPLEQNDKSNRVGKNFLMPPSGSPIAEVSSSVPGMKEATLYGLGRVVSVGKVVQAGRARELHFEASKVRQAWHDIAGWTARSTTSASTATHNGPSAPALKAHVRSALLQKTIPLVLFTQKSKPNRKPRAPSKT